MINVPEYDLVGAHVTLAPYRHNGFATSEELAI